MYICSNRSIVDGLVVMECEEPVTRRPTGQIVMDYLTDTVLSHKVTLLGQPYITPDSRIVVTVHREKASVTLIVQHTTGSGDCYCLRRPPALLSLMSCCW